MDLPLGSIASRKFVSNVGLITSNGPWGHNIMAAEWTRHISYEPGLIMVNIDPEDGTAENIANSKEFGVNLASESQNVIASIAGRYTGKEVDKIALLKELGIAFYDGQKINVPMLKGAALNLECQVYKQESLGDHSMFVGQILEITVDETIPPIVYHQGKYWKIGKNIPKPGQEILDKIAALAAKYRKTS